MAELASFYLVLTALLGAAMGSFAGVCIERWPLDASVRGPRSRCAGCQRQLAWYDNVPLLSYLLLRGRCRHCQAAIPVRLWLLEMLGAALFVAVAGRLGASIELWVWWPMTWLLLVVAYLDIDHFWVPDLLTYPGMVAATAAAFLPGRLGLAAALWGLLPALLLAATAWLFARLSGKDALGLGDVKLLALIGLCIGLPQACQVLMLAAFQGALCGGIIMLCGGHRARLVAEPLVSTTAATPPATAGEEPDWQPPPGALPFGPFLALATWQVVLLPEVLQAGQAALLRLLPSL